LGTISEGVAAVNRRARGGLNVLAARRSIWAMRRFLWVFPVAFFFLNPSFACGPAEPDYRFGADEMRAAVEGNWSFTIMPANASAPLRVTVKLEQSATAPEAPTSAAGLGLIRAAYACGSRTLVKSAGACTDGSVMPLTVSFVAGDPSFSSAQMSGRFEVNGTVFTPFNSDLELTVGDYQIHMQVSPDGSFLNAFVSTVGSEATLTIITRA
jgi:hypothetical protein